MEKITLSLRPASFQVFTRLPTRGAFMEIFEWFSLTFIRVTIKKGEGSVVVAWLHWVRESGECPKVDGIFLEIDGVAPFKCKVL